MSETQQIGLVYTRDHLDPALNEGASYPNHGEFDSDHMKLADLPEIVVEPDEGAAVIVRYAEQNYELRQALTRSRRKATNQKRELKRLNKYAVNERNQSARHYAELRVVRAERANVERENRELRKLLKQTEAALVEEQSKRRGLFGRR